MPNQAVAQKRANCRTNDRMEGIPRTVEERNLVHDKLDAVENGCGYENRRRCHDIQSRRQVKDSQPMQDSHCKHRRVNVQSGGQRHPE